MTTEPSTKLAKLRDLLRELFQLDQADLDFGIYRIMNQKRDEVERFLDDDLLPQVRAAFEKYRPADKAVLQTELEKTLADLSKYGVDPDTNDAVLDLRKRLAQSVDIAALEEEVFSDLFTFFRRYYHGGDFLSLRRYKEGVYAIPYEGEEVKLHWANHDQYYIKSSEHLTNYAFKIGKRRIRFELVAAGAERDNNKAQNGNERRFIVADEDPVIEDGGDLVVRFEYRPDADKRKQDALNAETASRVFAVLAELNDRSWQEALSCKLPTKKNPERTRLDKHLRDYTAKNSFDYFIHKDLGGFLRRELDFFIKNEILLLDDIDQVENFAKVEEKLSKIRVLRAIAHKIIAFLGQLEDFQKKLWLKKKFVVETNWCITLDRIPEEFYPEIAANDAQREEWVRLFAIDEIEGDLVSPGYSARVPLTVDFLRSQPALVCDTGHFPSEFVEQLIGAMNELDAGQDGLLVNGENHQALRILQARYGQQAKAIYIDPPYNTQKDVFPYKDGYKHGSWLSMMFDRVGSSRSLLREDGVFLSSIDSNEVYRFSILLEEMFGSDNHVGTVVWRNARDNNPTRIAAEHEYIVCFARQLSATEPVWKNEFADAKEVLLTEHDRLKDLGHIPSQIQSKLRTFIKDNVEILKEVDRYKFVDDGGVFTGSQSVHNPHPNGYEYEIHHPDTRAPMRMPANGYRFPETTMRRDFIDKGRLIFGPDEDRIVQIKLYLRDYQDSFRSVLNLDGRLGAYALNGLFGRGGVMFDNPKPPQLMRRLLSFASVPDSLILDFFAGSGTTIQGVIEVARMTNVRMRYIGVEMAEHFDSVLLPRVMKVVHASQWKDGRPIKRDGGHHAFKYIRLESYEDALDNLRLRERTAPQQQLLAASSEAREDYMLSYMLDVETGGSASLLNIEQFKNPFDYKLKVTRNNETKIQSVDLVETFNYLIGLRIEHMAARVHRTAKFERDEHERLQVKGKTKPCEAGDGWTFRVIQGRSPEKERVLVIWRVLTDDPEKDNLMLDTFCKKMGFSTKDMAFDLIYVNGDNNLENLRRDEDTWQVKLIEEHFHRLMFDVRDV